MKGVRLVLSDAAVADIIEQADWYESQSSPALAERQACTPAERRMLKF